MSTANDLAALLDAADSALMPLGVAQLVHENGYRLPNVPDAEQIAALTEVVDPAVYFEGDDPDSFAVGLLVAAGVAK